MDYELPEIFKVVRLWALWCATHPTTSCQQRQHASMGEPAPTGSDKGKPQTHIEQND